jgi:hypothetical protein
VSIEAIERLITGESLTDNAGLLLQGVEVTNGARRSIRRPVQRTGVSFGATKQPETFGPYR